eukprot:TRINITY_DN22907_c0_g1_i1.p2 TRINITY_DN22907_c0_g1~~TRINITY_DN22907_c0_g1_i1.p2  ORF type:complete len:206 (-),score=45.83 TRINITY_DN22907_c0_g1_i1:366-956(-)
MANSFIDLLTLLLLIGAVSASDSDDPFAIPMSFNEGSQLPKVGTDVRTQETETVEAQQADLPEYEWASGTELPKVGSDATVPDNEDVEVVGSAQQEDLPEFQWPSASTEANSVQTGEEDIVPVDIFPGRSGLKREWPELVGMRGEDAKAAVEQESPRGLKVYLVPHDAFVTMDYRTDRLRIYVDQKGVVSSVPRIG